MHRTPASRRKATLLKGQILAAQNPSSVPPWLRVKIYIAIAPLPFKEPARN